MAEVTADHEKAGREAAALYVAEARERGREVTAEVEAQIAAAETRRLAAQSERPTSPVVRERGSGMPPLSKMLPNFTPRDPSLLPEPEPPSYACEVCQDSGHVLAPRETTNADGDVIRLRPTQIVSRAPARFSGSSIASTHVVINCPACPEATQRSRLLRGVMPPGDILRCRFETYEPVTDGQRDALALVREWASGIEPRPFLILIGPVGVGKSHLAKAATLWRTEHGEPAYWATAQHVLSEIKRSFDPQTIADEQDKDREWWQRTPILSLDDLGRGYATGWNMAEIEEIIAERYEHERPTIITSNRDLDGIGRAQPDEFGRLVDRLGDVARTVYVPIDGPSHRGGTVDG